jgi:hypothetical protein
LENIGKKIEDGRRREKGDQQMRKRRAFENFV